MEDRTMTLTDSEGKEVVCDILFTYQKTENNGEYPVLQKKDYNSIVENKNGE